MRIRVQNQLWYNGLAVLIQDQGAIAKPLEFYQPAPGLAVEPTLVLDHCVGQQLMDDLWACGLRPSEGSGSAGSLRATEKHLADMRKLVIKFAKVDL